MNVSFSFQQQSKSDKNKQVTSPEDCDDLSPMPHVQVPPVRRRGGISAEPVSEEDATSYVKKVVSSMLIRFPISLYMKPREKHTKLSKLFPTTTNHSQRNGSQGGAQGLQNDGRSVEGHRQERSVCASRR